MVIVCVAGGRVGKGVEGSHGAGSIFRMFLLTNKAALIESCLRIGWWSFVGVVGAVSVVSLAVIVCVFSGCYYVFSGHCYVFGCHRYVFSVHCCVSGCHRYVFGCHHYVFSGHCYVFSDHLFYAFK